MLAFLINVSFASVYNVDIDRSGIANIILNLDDDETSVPLPADAYDFVIVGGSYGIEGNTALITSGSSGITTFSFKTRSFTSKNDVGWIASFDGPGNVPIQLTMPAFSILNDYSPKPTKVSSAGSRMAIDFSPGPVSVYYSLSEVPEYEESVDPLIIFSGALIIAVLLLKVKLPAKKKSGRKEMLETLNSNDLDIVNYLISNNFKARRNDLERKTGISKSSLALALNRLEKRKIIEMDRTSTTHFIKLVEQYRS